MPTLKLSGEQLAQLKAAVVSARDREIDYIVEMAGQSDNGGNLTASVCDRDVEDLVACCKDFLMYQELLTLVEKAGSL